MSPARFTLWCLLLASGAVLIGCAKEQTPAAAAVLVTPTENLEDAQKLAREARVACGENDRNCSPSVGLLTSAAPKGAGQCTASLVGRDLVLTNAHCLPEDLRAAGSFCTGRVFLHFPATDRHRAETAECAEVLSSVGGNGLIEKADVAFVRLRTAPSRPVLALSRAGLPDNSLVSVEKVNPVQSRAGLAGELVRTQCRIVYGSALLESGNHARAETNLASDCEIMGGNSGSALVAGNGTVRGVIFALLPEERARRYAEERRLGNLPPRLSPLNFATNLACLAWPGQAAPADCGEVKPESRESVAFRAALPARQKTLPALGRYEWSVIPEAEGTQFRARPHCVLLNQAPHKAVPHYLVELTPSLDSYLRSEAKITEVAAIAAIAQAEIRGLPICAR